MALTAIWVPGTAAIPRGQANIVDLGGGATYFLNANSDCWFHFPIPTPVILNDNRATVVAAQLLWSTSDAGGGIDYVRVYDGPNIILDQNLSPGAWGDHTTPWDAFNRWVFRHDGVAFGIGISAHFVCGRPERFQTGINLLITTAGIDFDYPSSVIP